MAENFNLIFGSQAPTTASWNDADYQTGWNVVGSTPPTAEQFDALQNRSDKKAQELNNRMLPLEQKAEEQGRQAGTAYTVGAAVTVDGLPADWLLVCTTAGTSGTVAITLPDPLLDGATITDGTITWTLRKIATNGSLGYRQPSTTYTTGNIAYHASLPTGYYLECTTAGTTGSSDLTISSPTLGGTVSDGTVVWTVKALQQIFPVYANKVIEAITDMDDAIKEGITTFGAGTANRPDASLDTRGSLLTTQYGTSVFQLALLQDGDEFNNIHTRVGYNLNTTPAWTPWQQQEAIVAKSISDTGYIKYASGLILQWGSWGPLQPNVSKNITFPISFTSVSKIVATAIGIEPTDYLVVDPHNSYFIATCSGTRYIMWFAIGY